MIDKKKFLKINIDLSTKNSTSPQKALLCNKFGDFNYYLAQHPLAPSTTLFVCPVWLSICIYFLLPLQGECIGFVQISEFPFSKDLYVSELRASKKHVLQKCLSVYISHSALCHYEVYMCQKLSNVGFIIKVYIYLLILFHSVIYTMQNGFSNHLCI